MICKRSILLSSFHLGLASDFFSAFIFAMFVIAFSYFFFVLAFQQ